MILSLILSLIFLTLAIIHFNWVLGGTFGFAESLPTKETGERVLNPKMLDSAIVAFGLLASACFYFLKSEIIEYEISTWVSKYGSWIIPSIFLLRAFGDFKYVGFFKKIKSTPFGKLDSTFFSPLCLVIGGIGVFIAFR
ncbi:MAG: DUF3995 domain-containing protein [Flavobacteriaceae bacterium]|nr:DUF3995 domain-containing protein [Flavobacteriaceae bacterium]